MTSYEVPSRLAFVVPDDVDVPEVFLMPLPNGSPVLLRATSAVIWVLAADGEADVAGAVSEVVDVPREQVESDVNRHLANLVSDGLLIARND